MPPALRTVWTFFRKNIHYIGLACYQYYVCKNIEAGLDQNNKSIKDNLMSMKDFEAHLDDTHKSIKKLLGGINNEVSTIRQRNII
jgi:F0F1-type ATP synthase membrane subunit b/b'